jgi:glycosyltransferase involved in cell wall biosynthesis
VRVLIVVPRQPEATGNKITAARHRDALQTLGHAVQVLEADPVEPFAAEAVAAFDPEIVHLLHAYRAGAPWLASGLATPFAVTLTGTDIHAGLADSMQGPRIRQVLERAAAIITQNRLTFARLQGTPEIAGRLYYLPPAVILGAAPCDLRQQLGATADDIVFLHPAGIRPVKGNLELLHLLAPLAAACPRLRLAFCGPVLDAEYGQRLQSALAPRPWASWLGALPPAAMPAAMRQADVILNHSACEGLPNSLVEAAALGRPILARAIDGNAAIVEPDGNGLLYRDDVEFGRHARALLENPALRRHLSRPAPDLADPLREAATLVAIYSAGLSASRKN